MRYAFDIFLLQGKEDRAKINENVRSGFNTVTRRRTKF